MRTFRTRTCNVHFTVFYPTFTEFVEGGVGWILKNLGKTDLSFNWKSRHTLCTLLYMGMKFGSVSWINYLTYCTPRFDFNSGPLTPGQ